MTVTFRSILVPTDFSAASVHALDYARALAERFGASLHLLHVVEDPVSASAWTEGYALSLTALREQFIDEAKTRLADQKAQMPDLQVTTETIVGHPARTIAELAGERHDDLIVMGTHGRSGVTHLLLGSVAERVIRLAPCPVLTIRQPDRQRTTDAVLTEAAIPA